MFKSHPRGLPVLFFTEMWERFSYYGMRGILLLFMTASAEQGGFGYDSALGANIYGLYTAMVYLLALPGGWLADRLIGKQAAVYYGGIIIAAGHFSMAAPGETFFFLGLLLIVVGTGLLKPNVSAIVGDLYGDQEAGAKRDAGFSIFYMGINLGAFLGPLVCGYLGENINWHLGFSAAGFGMLAGVIQYKMGLKHFGDAGTIKNLDPADKARAMRTVYFSTAVVGIIAVLFLSGSFEVTLAGFNNFMQYFILALVGVFYAYILAFTGLNTAEKKKVIVTFFLFLGAAVFWSGFEQAGSTMNLFARDLTDRYFTTFDWTMPASWLQSVNAIFIIILAPVFGSLWVWLQERNPSIPVKFGCGLILLGLGFLVMVWASTGTTANNPVSPNWLVATYFLHTCGELCLSPVGLSSITKLSPKHLVSQLMGIWFIGAALGNLIAGTVAADFDTLPLPELFGNVVLNTAGAGLLFLILAIPIKRMMGGVK